jgi:YfiH family protein
MIRLSLLDDPRLRHGFFTREGGVSTGIFASLNCSLGSGDALADIAENRRRAMAALGLGLDKLATCRQVHGIDVVTVEQPWDDADRPRADAMVTRQRGLALGILTADCAPVLLADAEAGVIGAAHAGWRGAFAGVVAATVEAMIRAGARAERMRAGIGPCIGFASYEVGPEFPAPFLAQDPANAAFFRAAPPGPSSLRPHRLCPRAAFAGGGRLHRERGRRHRGRCEPVLFMAPDLARGREAIRTRAVGHLPCALGAHRYHRRHAPRRPRRAAAARRLPAAPPSLRA